MMGSSEQEQTREREGGSTSPDRSHKRARVGLADSQDEADHQQPSGPKLNRATTEISTEAKDSASRRGIAGAGTAQLGMPVAAEGNAVEAGGDRPGSGATAGVTSAGGTAAEAAAAATTGRAAATGAKVPPVFVPLRAAAAEDKGSRHSFEDVVVLRAEGWGDSTDSDSQGALR